MDPTQFYRYHYQAGSPNLERIRKIVNVLPESQRHIMLDIGVGTGHNTKILANAVKVQEVWGVDISPEAVAEANANGIKAVTCNVDTADLPFESNFFNIVLCNEVIEHLFNPDHLLQEAYRVLKPAGLFILTTPNLAAWHNRIALLFGFQPHFTETSLYHPTGKIYQSKAGAAGHLRLYTVRALRPLLEIYGFKVLRIETFAVTAWFPRRIRPIEFIFGKSSSLASGIIATAVKND